MVWKSNPAESAVARQSSRSWQTRRCTGGANRRHARGRARARAIGAARSRNRHRPLPGKSRRDARRGRAPPRQGTRDRSLVAPQIPSIQRRRPHYPSWSRRRGASVSCCSPGAVSILDYRGTSAISPRGASEIRVSPLDRSATVALALSRRRKNAPRTPARKSRIRRASLLPNRTRQKTIGLTRCRRRRNCCATTIRHSRDSRRWKKTLAAGSRRRFAAMTAPPFPLPSARSSRAASAQKRYLQPQASPSGEGPHAWSA
jgi:hypothetical protein